MHVRPGADEDGRALGELSEDFVIGANVAPLHVTSRALFSKANCCPRSSLFLQSSPISGS